jgi:uncharacterized membrane protein (DUF485 family)
MSFPQPQDYTPIVGSQTDIAPLGSQQPPHERTAQQTHDESCDRIAAMPEFKELIRRKTKFIVPACIFFTVYYFALPVMVGYFPELMNTRIGPVNAAYLFALSQFFMAWILAAIYTRVAAGWDRDSAKILAALPTGGAK